MLLHGIQRLLLYIRDRIQFAHTIHELVTERSLRLRQCQLEQGGNRLFQIAELGPEGEQASGLGWREIFGKVVNRSDSIGLLVRGGKLNLAGFRVCSPGAKTASHETLWPHGPLLLLEPRGQG